MSPSLTNAANIEGQPVRDSSSPFATRDSAEARTYSSLEELPQTMLSLFEEAGRRSTFLTLPWFQNFVRTAMDPPDQLRLYSIVGGNEAQPASGMLVMRAIGRKNPFALRKLSSLSNYYTPFFSAHLSAAAGDHRPIVRALIGRIAQERPRWDAVELRPLDVDAEFFRLLVEEFRSAGFVTQTYFCAGNWYEPLGGRGYREYLEGLRSSVRNIAKSKNKKIERSGRVRCEIFPSGRDLNETIAAYDKVYSASWKVPEPYKEFIPGLIRTCAAQGTLRLGLAFVDGEPAAAQLWIVHSGVASIYKISYDQKFRELSVGTYLTTRMMEHAIDVDKVTEVDYLTGDDNYKKDWMSQRRERWGILALNPRTPRGALAIARHVGGRAVKHAARSFVKRFSARASRS